MWNNSQSDPEAPWRTDESSESSAGVQTRYLDQAAGAGLSPSARRRNNLIALGLLGVGVLMLFGRLMPGRHGPPIPPMAPHASMLGWPFIDIMPGIILFTIASVFLFFAFWRRIYPLIIPGFILSGLSVGVPLADVTGGTSVLWGLALGFVAIYLVGKALWRINVPWPLIPGAILFAVGTIVAMTQLPAFFAAGMLWLPLLLIGAGLYLGWLRR